jgi:hypothetical protein
MSKSLTAKGSIPERFGARKLSSEEVAPLTPSRDQHAGALRAGCQLQEKAHVQQSTRPVWAFLIFMEPQLPWKTVAQSCVQRDLVKRINSSFPR